MGHNATETATGHQEGVSTEGTHTHTMRAGWGQSTLILRTMTFRCRQSCVTLEKTKHQMSVNVSHAALSLYVYILYKKYTAINWF